MAWVVLSCSTDLLLGGYVCAVRSTEAEAWERAHELAEMEIEVDARLDPDSPNPYLAPPVPHVPQFDEFPQWNEPNEMTAYKVVRTNGTAGRFWHVEEVKDDGSTR